jgi:L-amino acid N-acyltransferase YncA
MAMIDQLTTYRRLVTLSDGVRVLIRPLMQTDKSSLLDLFAVAHRSDLDYFHGQASDPVVVSTWCDELDYSQVFPVIALVNDKIVGNAILQLGQDHHRHLGWVRLYLDRAFRRRGIGGLMLSALVDIARKIGLQQLVAEVPTHHVQVIKGFDNLGFEQVCVYNDFFMTLEGDTLDVAVMILRLVEYPSVF